jgi:hypothetical protein
VHFVSKQQDTTLPRFTILSTQSGKINLYQAHTPLHLIVDRYRTSRPFAIPIPVSIVTQFALTLHTFPHSFSEPATLPDTTGAQRVSQRPVNQVIKTMPLMEARSPRMPSPETRSVKRPSKQRSQLICLHFDAPLQRLYAAVAVSCWQLADND